MVQKRSIFEEVGTTQTAPATAPGAIDRGRSDARGGIRIWLMILFALVYTMIVVGGLTRLTDSGLSITEWRPLTGAIPPLSETDWLAEFDKYKNIDEWLLQNQWMTLADFKVIYWWEWGHRQLGRVIGLVWALGFLWFALRGRLPSGRAALHWPVIGWLGFIAIIALEVCKLQGLISETTAYWGELAGMALMATMSLLCIFARQIDWSARLLFIGLLGAMQGTIGWWMVESGVTTGEGMLDVASYRLATHLGLAFVIMGFITWYICLMGRPQREITQARRDGERKLFGMSTGLLHFAFLQILLGALVAGIDAGRSYLDWPLMGGEIFPHTAFDLQPFWRNFFENPGLVQFIHRTTGYLLVVFAFIVWLRSRRSAHPRTRFAFSAALCALFLQVVIGVVTVLYGAQWHVAITHQALAVLLWVLILRARFLAAYPISTSIRGA